MSVMTRRMDGVRPLVSARADDYAAAPAVPAGMAGELPGELAWRYRAGDEHQRLCLWLQHREARPALTRLEARQPAAEDGGGWDRLRRWLGLPGV
ncbi:MAG: hypothetical protein V1797_16445 [Pseudomonadota bacterium]